MNEKPTFEEAAEAIHRVEIAVTALRRGAGILLTDDEDRENEGDLIFPAERITPEQMAQMIRCCSGIVCLCITAEKARQLALPPMVRHNTNRQGTNFTVSVEAATGITTGVSAADRLASIRAAIAPHASPQDLARPGHLFPLIAHDRGVFGRRGHTEGSVDLMRIAGYAPCAVLCELTLPDGSMARRPEVERFARENGYPVVSVADIIRYRQLRGASES